MQPLVSSSSAVDEKVDPLWSHWSRLQGRTEVEEDVVDDEEETWPLIPPLAQLSLIVILYGSRILPWHTVQTWAALLFNCSLHTAETAERMEASFALLLLRLLISFTNWAALPSNNVDGKKGVIDNDRGGDLLSTHSLLITVDVPITSGKVFLSVSLIPLISLSSGRRLRSPSLTWWSSVGENLSESTIPLVVFGGEPMCFIAAVASPSPTQQLPPLLLLSAETEKLFGIFILFVLALLSSPASLAFNELLGGDSVSLEPWSSSLTLTSILTQQRASPLRPSQ